MIRDLRDLFEDDPLLGEKVRGIRTIGSVSTDEGRYRLLKALINMYGEVPIYQLYGPPGTFHDPLSSGAAD